MGPVVWKIGLDRRGERGDIPFPASRLAVKHLAEGIHGVKHRLVHPTISTRKFEARENSGKWIRVYLLPVFVCSSGNQSLGEFTIYIVASLSCLATGFFDHFRLFA